MFLGISGQTLCFPHPVTTLTPPCHPPLAPLHPILSPKYASVWSTWRHFLFAEAHQGGFSTHGVPRSWCSNPGPSEWICIRSIMRKYHGEPSSIKRCIIIYSIPLPPGLTSCLSSSPRLLPRACSAPAITTLSRVCPVPYFFLFSQLNAFTLLLHQLVWLLTFFFWEKSFFIHPLTV